jgi:hypothetical protein
LPAPLPGGESCPGRHRYGGPEREQYPGFADLGRLAWEARPSPTATRRAGGPCPAMELRVILSCRPRRPPLLERRRPPAFADTSPAPPLPRCRHRMQRGSARFPGAGLGNLQDRSATRPSSLPIAMERCANGEN